MANFTFPKQKDNKQHILFLNPSDLEHLTSQEKAPAILESSPNTYIISPHTSDFELMFHKELREFINEYRPNFGDVYILDNEKYINIQNLNYYQSDLNLIRILSDFCQILGAKYLDYNSTSYQDFSASLGLDISTTGILKKIIDPSLTIDISIEKNLKKDFQKTTKWEGHRKEEIITQKAYSIINSLRTEDQDLFKHILNQRVNNNSTTIMKEKLVIKRVQKNSLKTIAELAVKIPINNDQKNDSIFKLKKSIAGTLSDIFEHTIELELHF